MAVTLGRNISSLGAIRRLDEATSSLSQSFAQLSSGLRINRASDDAAGLAIASSLNARGRVYTQAIRNSNDAISLLNVADSSLGEGVNIIGRLRELATSAANGSLSISQRRTLDLEASQLQREFNRIMGSTVFNGLNILDGRLGNTLIQSGFGTAESLSFNVAGGAARNQGLGTYATAITTAVGSGDTSATGADFNNDGKTDLIVNGVVHLAVGDGTFGAGLNLGMGDTSPPLLVDVNGDGNIDVVGDSQIFRGNGDGTFGAAQAISLGGTSKAAGDFNGDGRLDLVSSNGATVSIQLANADGSYSVGGTFSAFGYALAVGDFDQDGKLDIATNRTNSRMSVYLGNGDGTMRLASEINVSGAAAIIRMQVGDFDFDGNLDILGGDVIGRIYQARSLGGGALEAFTTVSTTEALNWVFDANNDGVLDIATNNGVRLGNGDGTFGTRVTNFSIGGIGNAFYGDFDGDGVQDICQYDEFAGSAGVNFANTQQVTSLERLNLLSRSNALNTLNTIETAFNRLEAGRAMLGSFMSRLDTTTRRLGETTLNYEAAKSRIESVDLASESARLVRSQITQQVAQGVLAQANQIPALALALLGDLNF